MAHLPRQQRLVLKCLLQFGVRLLTFDGDAEQASKAGQKVGIRLVKLAGIGAIDLQYAEERFALPALFDQHVDRAPDAVILADAGRHPGIALTTIDLAAPRIAEMFTRPGDWVWKIDMLNDRRPDTYAEFTRKHERLKPVPANRRKG